VSDPALTDTAGASAHVGVPARTLEHWRYVGEGPPYYKLGRSVRYDLAALDEWLTSRLRAA
jgi:predicted DNA-binding transcriptional regulator AlpA